MDLAHTRRALDALRSHAVTTDQLGRPEFSRAELFLRVVQRHPGALAGPSCFADTEWNRQSAHSTAAFIFRRALRLPTRGGSAMRRRPTSVAMQRRHVTGSWLLSSPVSDETIGESCGPQNGSTSTKTSTFRRAFHDSP